MNFEKELINLGLKKGGEVPKTTFVLCVLYEKDKYYMGFLKGARKFVFELYNKIKSLIREYDVKSQIRVYENSYRIRTFTMKEKETMREIKFKGLIILKDFDRRGEIVQVCGLYYESDGRVGVEFLRSGKKLKKESSKNDMVFLWKDTEILLLEYLGSKDKNGTEIYEGDIVEIKEVFVEATFNHNYEKGVIIDNKYVKELNEEISREKEANQKREEFKKILGVSPKINIY